MATTHLVSMGSASSHERLYEAVRAIHYSAPWVILAYYVTAATVSVCTLQTIAAKIKDHKAPRKVILWAMMVIMATYVRELTIICKFASVVKGRTDVLS